MKLLHDVHMWDSKDSRTQKTVPFLTDVSPKYFRTHHPKYSSEEASCFAWDGTTIKVFDLEHGKFRLCSDEETMKSPEVLGIKMLMSVPLETLAQWMTWPELGSPDMVRLIRSRMEGLV